MSENNCFVNRSYGDAVTFSVSFSTIFTSTPFQKSCKQKEILTYRTFFRSSCWPYSKRSCYYYLHKEQKIITVNTAVVHSIIKAEIDFKPPCEERHRFYQILCNFCSGNCDPDRLSKQIKTILLPPAIWRNLKVIRINEKLCPSENNWILNILAKRYTYTHQ